MTPAAIARVIAETLDPVTRGTIRGALASTRYLVDGPAATEGIDAGLAWADEVILRVAERIVQGNGGAANDR